MRNVGVRCDLLETENVDSVAVNAKRGRATLESGSGE